MKGMKEEVFLLKLEPPVYFKSGLYRDSRDANTSFISGEMFLSALLASSLLIGKSS